MKNLQRRIGNLECASNPPGAPLVVWEGSPMPSDEEAAGRELVYVRWLREGETIRGGADEHA
jgi:hypothetical protein